MKKLLLTAFLISLLGGLSAQKYVYAIKADSTKLTGCDSNELIIENHTQNVPGFLFNTGNGRTQFRRGVFKLNDSMFVIGADTLTVPSPARSSWLLTGNSGIDTTYQFFGTNDNQPVIFHGGGYERMRLFANGDLGINTGPTDNTGFRLQVNGNVLANGSGHLLGNLAITNGFDVGPLSSTGIRIDTPVSYNSFIFEGSTQGWATNMFTFTSAFGNTPKDVYYQDGSIVKIQSGFRDANVGGLSGNTLYLNPTYNLLSGSAAMTLRGLYYNPVVTNLVAGSHHVAIETVSGDVLLGTTSGNTGIRRSTPNVLLDLPGPVNIDDTSAYNFNYHPVVKIGGWVGGDYYTNENLYTNVFLGDSTGLTISFPNYGTYVGNAAGQNDAGGFSTLFGYGAGMDNQGWHNVYVGFLSGQNSSPDDQGNAGYNTFVGNYSGTYSSGASNTFTGFNAGTSNTGSSNTFSGYNSGMDNRGNYNISLGYGAGSNNQSDSNIYLGVNAGSFNNGKNNIGMGASAGDGNAGSDNVLIGLKTGINNNGSNNTIVGAGSATDLNYTAARNGITLLGSNISVVTWRADGVYHASSSPISDATAIGYNSVVKTSNTMVFGDTAVNSWLFNTNAVASSGAALVVGNNSTNGNGAYLTTGGVWTNASDKNKKEHFQNLNTDEILSKIEQLPISRWNYKGLPEQHIGPVAQDFYQLFQVGTDDKTISTIDPSGIALAGIQGLYHKLQEAEQQKQEMTKQIDQLQERLDKLEKAIESAGQKKVKKRSIK